MVASTHCPRRAGNNKPDKGRAAVRNLISTLWLVSLLAPGTAVAQAFPPNEMGVTMGHWHLNSVSVEANQKILVGMGGTAIKPGDFNIVRFPGVAVFLHLRQTGTAPTGGTDGSVVNHVGFIVPNVQEAVARWKAAGVPVKPGNNERLDQAWVTTPDGLRIEVLEDKAQTMPIRHEHVHFFVEEAAIPQMQAWYVKHFGAKPGVRNNAPVADIPGTQLRFNKSATPTVTTKGRILDHIGFDVTDLRETLKRLEAAGVKIDRPYTPNPLTGDGLAFIYDPWGTYIELNERKKPL
jgi:catechol 2,3-dioxygenase-like lactoylglutathione lyase family enzyme